MVKQPPQLLTRVIRAIGSIRDPKGAGVPAIVNEVKAVFQENDHEVPRNLTMQVRRALKHAIDNGSVSQRAGKYRVLAKKRVVPVDSLENAIDGRSRRKSRRGTRKRRRSRRRRRSSEQDFTESRRRRRSRKRKSRRRRSREAVKSNSASAKGGSSEQQRAATPSASASNVQNRQSANNELNPDRQESPFADSESAGLTVGRRRRRRRRRQSRQQQRTGSGGPPAVEDDMMDKGENPRMEGNQNARKVSLPPRQENNDDSLDDAHDQPPSYYN